MLEKTGGERLDCLRLRGWRPNRLRVTRPRCARYGIGHCAVIVAAGTSTEAVQNYLNWNEKSKGVNILKRICGVLVMLGGVYLIYAAN